jgi:signal transduction histidine kinase
MKISVLIADDEAEVAARVLHKIQDAGFTICEMPNRRPDESYARDGKEAIELAREYHPDIVLMDINMETPFDGVEAGSVIMSSLDIPVVYVTAYGDPATVSVALESHPYGFLPKAALDDGARLKVAVQMAIGLNKALREKAHLEADHAKLSMARAVAHDLNNFIVQIEGSMKTAEDALRDVKNMASLMMDYAERLEPTNLGTAIWSQRYYYSDSRLKDVQVKFEPPIGETWVNACTTSIKRLLSNLVSNAVRHGSRPGMIVHVRVKGAAGDEANSETVRLEVSDTGKGMSREVLHKLLAREAYSNHAEGHGIGFGNVWKIVDSHQGKLAIDSTLEVGTTVTIDFPSTAPVSSVPTAVNRPHILVVEDEEALCQLAEMKLEDAGFRVTATAMAEEALELVAGDSSILLILSDRNLVGKLNGLGLARRVQINHPSVAVLLTSGDSSDLSADGTLAGFPFLPKASQQELLVEKVSECLRMRSVRIPERRAEDRSI